MSTDKGMVYFLSKNASLREKAGTHFVILADTRIVHEVSQLGATILRECQNGLPRDVLLSDLKCNKDNPTLLHKVDEFLDDALSLGLIEHRRQ